MHFPSSGIQGGWLDEDSFKMLKLRPVQCGRALGVIYAKTLRRRREEKVSVP